MIRTYLLVIILLAHQAVFSQAYDHIWLTGYDEFPGLAGYGHAQIQFENDTVVVEQASLAFNFESTVAVMSDADGNLLFYTNGCQIADRNHQIMPNGSGLNPGAINDLVCPWKGYIVQQGAMALPDPGNVNRFYLLHMGASYDPVLKLKLGPLYYSIVDMTLQNGLGDVISKNNVLQEGDLGSFTAIRHGNGRDWWIVVPEFGNQTWHMFIISPQGIEAQALQNIAPILPDCEKYMATAISLQGNKVANWGDCKVTVLDFERCSGSISNSVEIESPTHWIPGGGVDFSPSGRYLYATSQNVLFRADLEAASPQLDTMRFSYDPFLQSPYDVPGNTFHYLVNGPDGFIYGNIPSRARHLHILKNPDGATIADLDFKAKAVTLPVTGVRTLPHLPNYRLYDLPDSPCDTLGIDVAVKEPKNNNSIEMTLTPNPANESLTVQFDKDISGQISITDITGKIWLTDSGSTGQTTFEASIRHLPAGVYIVSFRSDTGLYVAHKLVVQH